MMGRRLFHGAVAMLAKAGDFGPRAAIASSRAPLVSSPSCGSADELRRGTLFSMAAPLAVAAGDTGAVYHIHSEEAWYAKLSLLGQPAEKLKLAVVDFTAQWCGPCKMVAPVFKELSKKYPNVLFLKVDVDELPEVTSDWKVNAMPTFVFIVEKREVHRVVGADVKALEAKIVELSSKQ